MSAARQIILNTSIVNKLQNMQFSSFPFFFLNPENAQYEKWGQGGSFFFCSHASTSGFSCVLIHFCLLLLMLIFKCCRCDLLIEPTDLKRKEKKKRHLFLETSFEIRHSYLVSLDWFHMFCLRLMFPTSTGKSPSRIFLQTFHCGKLVSRWAFQQVMSFSESDNVTSR